ncbi:type I secretion system permease/ATPase [Ferrimonas gelatinilytica]|uniref:Type I secretion system permease/ATPase n=1 Tax=Ferrimonas gelatinilytica TaxID=1255257 RepID=A0ABP9RUG2_9GAMM
MAMTSNPQQHAAPVASPLLDNLLWLAAYHGLQAEPHSVVANIPLLEGDLPLSHLEDAARRAGLNSRRLSMPLAQLGGTALPCLLALRDQPPMVLLSLADDQATLLDPLSQGELVWPRSQLEAVYLGQAILVKPALKPDNRADTPKTAEGHWFWQPVRRSASLYRDIIIASLLINLFALVSPLFIMNVYDRIVPNLAYDSLWVLALGAAIAYLFDILLKQARAALIDYAGKQTDLSVSRTLFSRMLGMQMQHRPLSTGAMARQFGEFDSVREFIASTTIGTLVDLPFSLLFLAIIAWVAGPLVLPPLLAIVLMIAITAALQPKMAHASQQSQRFADLRHAHLYESITGLETIKSAGAEGAIQYSWEKMQAHSADWQMKSRKLTNLASHLCAFLVQLSVLLVVIIGVYRLESGLLSMGGIIAAVILTGRAISPMAQMIGLLSRMHQIKATVGKLDELMQLPQDTEAHKHYPDVGRLQGRLQASDLHFRYDDNGPDSLRQVNFSINAGERVALIGRNGSGKTSLAKLLLGLLRPSSGQLRFDGKDSLQLHSSFLRHQIGYVPQDVKLFYGSIRDNILLGSHQVSDAQLLAAVERSGVALFTDLDADGLNRQVGESGSALSAGQRQSVALARALLNDPPILILDEPTASLDARAERQFTRTLAALPRNKTIVLITHKQPLLELVDRILVLERGRLVANGPKSEVLKKLRQDQPSEARA